MITLTKIDGNRITVNADEIDTIECLHDTIISLKSGKMIIVVEKNDEIVDKVINYKRKCLNTPVRV